jgi:formylmethanofuran dehydrogenase subunit B
VASAIPPSVRFTTAVYGIHLPGTAYRMDEVPIPLRAVLPPQYASDADVLDALCERLEAAPRTSMERRSHHPL